MLRILRTGIFLLTGVVAVLSSDINSKFHGTQSNLPTRIQRADTIYEVLSQNPEYSKLTKAIDYVDEIASLLKDASATITFFATPNHVLRHANRYPHPDKSSHHEEAESSGHVNMANLVGAYELVDVIHLLDEFEASKNDSSDEKREYLKRVLHAILSYHIIPESLDVATLGSNATYPTNLILPDPLGGRPLRVRLMQGFAPLDCTINFSSQIIRPGLYASNGKIHGISYPLLPPPSVFQQLYMAPFMFSTFTSLIQGTGLMGSLDLYYVRGKESGSASLEGTHSVTVFAPSNAAFEGLPRNLQVFLFSPAGAHILKKILQLHIVPDLVLHSDHVYNGTLTSNSTLHGSKGGFVISEVGCLDGATACLYPMKHRDMQDAIYFLDGDFFPQEMMYNTDDTSPQEQEVIPTPRAALNNPFEFNTKHREEILDQDTETYEALSDPQQDYIARFLELYDTLTSGGSFHQPFEPPINEGIQIPQGLDQPPHLCCSNRAEQTSQHHISSNNLTVQTLFTNHSVQVYAERFNTTSMPPNGPEVHKTGTKLSVDGNPAFLFDLVGLNGVVHMIDRLLDPRGRQRRNPWQHLGKTEFYAVDDFSESEWDDWEDWLLQWAAEN